MIIEEKNERMKTDVVKNKPKYEKVLSEFKAKEGKKRALKNVDALAVIVSASL